MKVFDLMVLVALLMTAYRGYQSGLIQNVFKTIGYITGGILGVAFSVQILSHYSEVRFKLITAVIIILLLAILGEFILGKIGFFFKKTLYTPLLKFIDSISGAILSITRLVFIIYLLSVILVSASSHIGGVYISHSKFYIYTDLYLPNIITDLKGKVEKLLNNH